MPNLNYNVAGQDYQSYAPPSQQQQQEQPSYGSNHTPQYSTPVLHEQQGQYEQQGRHSQHAQQDHGPIPVVSESHCSTSFPSTTRPTIAFFGATGGCTAAALAPTLLAGYEAVALARKPSKLLDLLRDTHHVPPSTLSANLTVIQGDITSVSALRSVLNPPSGPVSLIIFGIGGLGKMQASLMAPVTIDNPNICEQGSRAVVDTLRILHSEGVIKHNTRPTMMIISTTGVSERQRDVPMSIYPLYHYTLAVPHKDKKLMEEVVLAASSGPNAPLRDIIIVRPTLLGDGQAKGLDRIRVGWEWPMGREGAEKAPGPQLGYMVHRADVGNWIFEEVVKGMGKWEGKCVTLTN